jgi:hypothetical protein
MKTKHHKKNSGNQPEFQSSIKKRTVNQTVCHRKNPNTAPLGLGN